MYNLGKITNSKDLIKAFMKEKDKILFNLTGMHLYSDGDYEDVDSWNNEVCNRMKLSAHEDSQCCPACIKYTIDCDKCRYGMLHGDCMGYDSNYKNILYKLYKKEEVKAFCLLGSIEKLVDNFNYKQELLRLGADNVGKFDKYVL